MPDPAARISGPSAKEYNLSIANIVIYAPLFFLALWITWKHGKPGIVCWPIFASYFVIQFVSDAFLIMHKNDETMSKELLLYTDAGSIACLTLTLLGVAYEAYGVSLSSLLARWLT